MSFYGGSGPVCGLYRVTVVQNNFYNCLKTVHCFNIPCNAAFAQDFILVTNAQQAVMANAQAKELQTNIAQTLIEPVGRMRPGHYVGVFGITSRYHFVITHRIK